MMKTRPHEKGLFLYIKSYESIFKLLKNECKNYSYYANDEDEIYWFYIDEVISLAENILNKEDPTIDENDLLEFIIANGFGIEYCCNKFEIAKKKAFENILFYK